MLSLVYWLYGVGCFFLEILVAEYLFTYKRILAENKLKNIILSLILDIMALGVATLVLTPMMKFLPGALLGFFMYFFVVLSTLPGLCILLDASLSQNIMYMAEGYLLQHLTSQIAIAAREILGIYMDWKWFLSELLLYGLVFGVIYYLFIRRIKNQESIPSKAKLSLSLLVLLVVWALSTVRDIYTGESLALTIITRVFSVLCSFLVLIILTGVLQQQEMAEELEQMELLRSMELKQYQRNRENIELINIKCHDLKRRIGILEKTGLGIPEEEINRLKKAVDIYDSKLYTGNDTLDIILSEKSFYCKEYHIRLTCIADGEALHFMSDESICSIFGNAIDNAIEATTRVANPDNRFVRIKVYERMGMVVIEIENTYEGKLELVNGIPKSTKENEKGYHGYGIKSIKMSVEEYSGQLQIKAEDTFSLIALIPKVGTVLFPRR